MKFYNNLKRKIFLGILTSYFIATISWSQIPTTPPPTPPSVRTSAQQNQEMLQEIQRLREIDKKQQEKINTVVQTQQPFTGQPMQNAPRPNVLPKLYITPPRTRFEYPFASQQVKNTPTYEQIHQQAFSGAAQQAIPMSPRQIHRIRQIYEAAQFAASAPGGVPPKPTATSLFINLSPGATPPVIRLGQGFVTSLVFLDSTGAPWPIAAYDNGNPSAFNIAWDMKDNILMIQAQTLYTYGNLAVRLKGLNTPIMLTLIPGQSVVDYRVDAHVPGYGPDAVRLPMQTGLPPKATPILLNIVDGIPPQGSKTLHISDDIGQAWIFQGKLFLRTRDTLLSPGWLATMSSADGTKAYELQITPMLLIAKNGKVIHVRIGGI